MRNNRRAGKPAGRKPEKQGLTGLFTKGKNIPTTAQQTLPYREMYRDGVCRVADRYYTKTIEYEDINYQLAQSEDQAAIFDGWSACLNYFDSSLPFQLSFLNHRSRPGSRYSVNIPMQDDDYNSVRCEYVEMLENQIAKSNNGIVRTKLLTFGVNVDDLSTARARLERVEADICGNFKKLGVKCRSLSGLERLELLHGQLHPGSGSPFRFSWDMIPKTGLSTKDFIAPDSFDFRFSRLFRVGTTWGAASYLQILASELSDKLLAELLEMDAEMTITLHIQTVDQAAAVKSIKAKVSDIDKMKEGMQCLGVKWSLRNTSEIVEYWYEVLLGIKCWIEREQTELKYEPSAEEKAAGIAQFSLVVGEMATITALAKDYSKDPDEILEWKYGKVYNLLFTNLQSHLFRERLNKELERKAQQKANARKPRNKWR